MSTLTTPKKKDESFFDKIGTLGRKKKKEGKSDMTKISVYIHCI